MITRILIFLLFFSIFLALLAGLSCLIGWILKHLFHLRSIYFYRVAAALVGVCVLLALYGSKWGFAQFNVRHETITFRDLPEAFDGYRIAMLADLHIATFDGREELLAESIDSALAAKPDLIVFAGDIQNHAPEDIEPYIAQLSRLKAKDGVYSVLGNHDYGYPRTKESPIGVRRAEERAGWTVLVNENRTIERDSSRIVIAGMDNDGDGKRFPQRGDIAKTLRGTTPDDFIIMLEHDPTSWRRKILPGSHAQLTLSGHTHAMQFGIAGWTPATLVYTEPWGLFTEGDQRIFVSSGLGGLIAFRLGMPRELVIIDLKKE